MTSTNITPTRDALINHITNCLNPLGFLRGVKTICGIPHTQFVAAKQLTQPGRRVIINNRIMEEPPVRIPIRFFVELHGSGSYESSDGRCDRFELVCFGMEVNGERREETTNVHYGFHEEFNLHLKRYFGI